MTFINATNSNASAEGSITTSTENETHDAAVVSNFDSNTAIVSLEFVHDPTGTAKPSLSVQATGDVEESLCYNRNGEKAARSIRDMHTFHVNMLNRYPAVSEDLRYSLRNGMEQRVQHHNDTKAGSDLGLSFADEPVADQKAELESVDMEAIVIAAEQADLIDKTDKEREELKAARLAAEDKEVADEEGSSMDDDASD